MNVNILKLNMDKSQLLMRGKKRIINLYQSQIPDLNTALQITSDVLHTSKLLGVVLDSNLCFADMINNTRRICFFKLSKLQSIRHFLSSDTEILLVKSFITGVSCLDYCNILYACSTKILLN